MKKHIKKISSLVLLIVFTTSIICNASSIQPVYYKNELSYNPITWEEWNKSSGVTADSTGIELNSSSSIGIGTTFKKSTNYGFLFNVVSTNATSLVVAGGGAAYPFTIPSVAIDGVGNKKAIKTTKSDFTQNRIIIGYPSSSIKIKDTRIFELPTGSQIESDFNTLTADELALKYPFEYGNVIDTTEENYNVINSVMNLFKGIGTGILEITKFFYNENGVTTISKYLIILLSFAFVLTLIYILTKRL